MLYYIFSRLKQTQVNSSKLWHVTFEKTLVSILYYSIQTYNLDLFGVSLTRSKSGIIYEYMVDGQNF